MKCCEFINIMQLKKYYKKILPPNNIKDSSNLVSNNDKYFITTFKIIGLKTKTALDIDKLICAVQSIIFIQLQAQMPFPCHFNFVAPSQSYKASHLLWTGSNEYFCPHYLQIDAGNNCHYQYYMCLIAIPNLLGMVVAQSASTQTPGGWVNTGEDTAQTKAHGDWANNNSKTWKKVTG